MIIVWKLVLETGLVDVGNSFWYWRMKAGLS